MKPQFEPREVFELELARYGLSWCQGECGASRNHKRGFVLNADKKTVHLKAEVTQARSLHRALHEIGHCLDQEKGLRSYQREEKAEAYAAQTMRDYGYAVPRYISVKATRYIQRKKRHGDHVRKGMRS